MPMKTVDQKTWSVNSRALEEASTGHSLRSCGWLVPALPAGVAAEQRLGLKVGDSSLSWSLKQCDANAALEGSSRGRGLARCAVFPCVPREKMKNTKKSGWNALARHAENIPSEQRFIPYLAGHSFHMDVLHDHVRPWE